MKSCSASYTSRCRITADWLVNKCEVIRTRKWLPKPVPLAPAWPWCWQLSSITSSAIGCRVSRKRCSSCCAVGAVDRGVVVMVAFGVGCGSDRRFIGFHVARDVEALANDKNQRKGIAPKFEIDPGFSAVIGRDIGIDERHEGAIHDPDPVQPHPYRLRQRQLAAQHQLEEVLLPDPYRQRQADRHGGIQHGGFP